MSDVNTANWAALVPWDGIQNRKTASSTEASLVPPLPGDATKYYDGTGKFSTPGGGGGGAPSGPAGGDLGGTYPNPKVIAVHETGGGAQLTFASIPDGTFLKRVGGNIVGGTPSGSGNVTGPASAVSGHLAVFSGTSGEVIADGGAVPTALPPNGPAGGDLAGTYPNPTLNPIGSATGPIGDSTHVSRVTIDAKGRVTGLTSVAISTLTNPMTDVGDMIRGGSAGAPTRVAGNTTTRRRGLMQTGTGAASAAPVFTDFQEFFLSDFPSLAAADTAASGAGGMIVLDVASVAITSSTSIASPVRFTTGTFAISAAQVLTFAKGILGAPLVQIFSGTGTVQLDFHTPAAWPEWWGAGTGGSTGDDGPAIMAAINACYNAAGSATFYFANRPYYLKTTITVSHPVPIGSLAGAILFPSGTAPAANAIILSAGDYEQFITLPTIGNFTGTGLRLYGTNVCNIKIGLIVACGTNIEIYTDDIHTNCLDNNIFCQFNANATVAAVQVTVLGSSTIVQGNYIYCNFINGCKRWFYKTSNGGNFPGNNVNANRYECEAIDFDGIANCTMIECDMIYSGSPVWIFGERYLVVSGFDGGAGSGFLVFAGTFDGNDFDFGGSLPAVGYANVGGTEPTNGYGNRYLSTWGAYEIGTIPATTSANTRSSWNGGTMSGRNRISCSFVLPGTFATGATADFYVYSPFVKGNSRLSLAGGGGSTMSLQGCICTVLADQSGTHANEVRIQFMNVSGSTLTSATIYAVLVVGIP